MTRSSRQIGERARRMSMSSPQVGGRARHRKRPPEAVGHATSTVALPSHGHHHCSVCGDRHQRNGVIHIKSITTQIFTMPEPSRILCFPRHLLVQPRGGMPPSSSSSLRGAHAHPPSSGSHLPGAPAHPASERQASGCGTFCLGISLLHDLCLLCVSRRSNRDCLSYQ